MSHDLELLGLMLADFGAIEPEDVCDESRVRAAADACIETEAAIARATVASTLNN